MTNYEKLLAKLTEMFQLDQADLDFGIYRIMNSKRDEIVRFLEKDLLPQVKEVLGTAQGDIAGAGAEELKQAEDAARALGVKPEDSPKVRELRAKYSGGGDLGALEQEVFNHLYSFFRRYYDEGDFLSLRRYKDGVYAIPYEGEEVKLHWANADQYYIKTAEHFRDFIFKVGDRRVHFKLVDAQTERDNNKEQEKRVFILTEENPVAEEGGELIIRFEYRNDSAKRKQKELTEAAIATILESVPSAWKALLTTKAPTDRDSNRTVLAKRLNEYTTRNTFDYFIHKDLGGFLRRELDFYIKNEVMHLDDIENEAAPKVEQYLAKVRAIRRVAGKLIDFLAQIEEFQKSLWLKKKFVVETSYIITLNRIPHDLYPEVLANQAQIEEWKKLFAIERTTGSLDRSSFAVPLTEEFLAAHGSLPIDTSLFPSSFTKKLIRSFQSLDEDTTGILVQGDNFHALRLFKRRFKSRLKCIYIDPPYNAKTSEILYKNTFKHSSWLSMMESRLQQAKILLHDDAVLTCAIDENEQERLGLLLESLFPGKEKTCVSVIHNPRGIQGLGLSHTHESAFFVHRNGLALGMRELADSKSKPLMKTGSESERSTGRNCFYPIWVRDDAIVGFGEVPEDDWHPESATVQLEGGAVALYPISSTDSLERKWRYARQSIEQVAHQLELRMGRNGEPVVYLAKEAEAYRTVWSDAEFNAAEYGSTLLKNMLGRAGDFSFPKSLWTVYHALKVARTGSMDWVLDFFAGSGTTAHAVMQLNRDDGQGRRFLLVEMGAYFESTLVPRVKKALYAAKWSEGQPVLSDEVDGHSGSGLIKVVRCESYEDSLANIEFSARTATQNRLVERDTPIHEGYVLSYMLNAETNGSPSRLSVAGFDHPFEYKLKIAADTVGETKEVSVDLVETFNWLLGLRVYTMDVIRGFHVVTGRLPGQGNSENGEKALIIWRDTTENPNKKLDEFFAKQAYNTLDQEFDVIYVNGDNNLQNLRKDDQAWKVRLIEEEFHRLMWDVEDV